MSPIKTKDLEGLKLKFTDISGKVKKLDISDDDNNTYLFEGYAAVYEKADYAKDVIAKGAFNDSLMQVNPNLLYMHDRFEMIGKTIEFSEDDFGLKMKASINLDVQRGKEAASLIEDGSLVGLSVGFAEVESEIKEMNINNSIEKVNYIKRAKLFEVSVVDIAAYPDAKIFKKEKSIREIEKILRDEVNLSRSKSKLAAKYIHDLTIQRDAECEDEKAKNQRDAEDLSLKTQEHILNNFNKTQELICQVLSK